MPCKILPLFPKWQELYSTAWKFLWKKIVTLPCPCFEVFLLEAFWGIIEKESFFRQEKKSLDLSYSVHAILPNLLFISAGIQVQYAFLSHSSVSQEI